MLAKFIFINLWIINFIMLRPFFIIIIIIIIKLIITKINLTSIIIIINIKFIIMQGEFLFTFIVIILQIY
jgi:hypothetical protein